jgi:hypothetical protein
MSEKPKNRRGLKKEIVRRFEQTFDLKRLNYKARSKTTAPKAALIGFTTAGGLYSVGFFLGFVAVDKNVLPLDMFARLVWIIMIPTTIVGFLVWQITKNRMEFPVRSDIRNLIAELEQNGGLLWRYFPIFDALDPEHADLKKAFIWSQEKRTDKLAIEEYCDAVLELAAVFREGDAREFTVDMLEQVARNLELDPNKI